MATILLSNEERKQLVTILTRYVLNQNDRQRVIEDAGLQSFQAQLQFDTDARTFAQSLVRVLQDYGTLRDTGAPALSSLLLYLAEEQLTGHPEDQAFVMTWYNRAPIASTPSTSTKTKPSVTSPQATSSGQKTVLAVFSSPSDFQFLPRLKTERNRFKDVLSFNRDYLYVSIDPRQDELVRELDSKPPYLFHYSGHAQAAGIVLLQEDSDESELIKWNGLGRLLALSSDTLRVVVLNGCGTIAPDFFAAFGNNRPTIIATTEEIFDSDASKFTGTFYEQLARGRSPRDAFDRAVIKIMLTDDDAAQRYRFIGPEDSI